jgi:hypothetical protein
VMDYSLLLGVHYPARHFTRASLEAGPSFSLDGTLPHVSPQPGGTLPGAGGAAAAVMGAGEGQSIHGLLVGVLVVSRGGRRYSSPLPRGRTCQVCRRFC